MSDFPPKTPDEINTWLPRHYSSQERPRKFSQLADALDPDDDTDAALFWSALAECWSGFDAIDHVRYLDLMSLFTDGWRMSPEIAALPNPVTVFRGQLDDYEPGLSWTLDRSVAVKFARGHRGVKAPNPVVLCATVRREDIALYLTDRSEAEVVLFAPPDEYEPTSIEA